MMLRVVTIALMLSGTLAFPAKSSRWHHALQKDVSQTTPLALDSNATKSGYLRALGFNSPLMKFLSHPYVEPYRLPQPLIIGTCILIAIVGNLAVCFFCLVEGRNSEKKPETAPARRERTVIRSPRTALPTPMFQPPTASYIAHSSPRTMLPSPQVQVVTSPPVAYALPSQSAVSWRPMQSGTLTASVDDHVQRQANPKALTASQMLPPPTIAATPVTSFVPSNPASPVNGNRSVAQAVPVSSYVTPSTRVGGNSLSAGRARSASPSLHVRFLGAI